jgi:hypothetical protein
MECNKNRVSKIGIVYISFGENSYNAAMNSYGSILKFCSIPAVIIGDKDCKSLPFIKWKGVTPWEDSEPAGQRFYAGRVKPFLYYYTPFDLTLYLDADTQAYDSILPGFKLLDNYDLCVADDPRVLEGTFKRSKQGKEWDWIRDQRDFTHNYLRKKTNPQINTGVIFFRKSKCSELFFKNWYEEWLRFPKWDEQMAFMRAEHNNPNVKILHLNTRWNTNNVELPNKIIYHMWGQQKARDVHVKQTT